MKIGELAKATGANSETIRYYEKIGLLPRPDRTDSNYRDYGPRDAERLAFIRHARSLGFEISNVRSLIELAEQPDLDCAAVDTIASRHLADVEIKIARLNRLRDELGKMVRDCRGGSVGSCRIIEALGDHSHCGPDHLRADGGAPNQSKSLPNQASVATSSQKACQSGLRGLRTGA